MKLPLLALAVAAAVFTSACTPLATATRPVVMKISTNGVLGPAQGAIGTPVTIQGRDLGGPASSTVLFGADDLARGGVVNAAADVVSWTPSEIVVKVPAGLKAGGGYVFVTVQGVRSNGLSFSVGQ
jgi:hypothetical protein